MEFKSLKNIETSFRQIRLFTLVFLGLCACINEKLCFFIRYIFLFS